MKHFTHRNKAKTSAQDEQFLGHKENFIVLVLPRKTTAEDNILMASVSCLVLAHNERNCRNSLESYRQCLFCNPPLVVCCCCAIWSTSSAFIGCTMLRLDMHDCTGMRCHEMQLCRVIFSAIEIPLVAKPLSGQLAQTDIN